MERKPHYLSYHLSIKKNNGDTIYCDPDYLPLRFCSFFLLNGDPKIRLFLRTFFW